MKDLTYYDEQELLKKVKSFLEITWDDEDENDTLLSHIRSSITFIDDVCGCELDYVHTHSSDFDDKKFFNASIRGQELLLNRVFYLREKAVDDFDKNYRSSIVALNLLGRVIKNAEQS